jgi:hypothetical protein
MGKDVWKFGGGREVCTKLRMIDSIVTAIVRPPRARYTSQDLGAYKFRHKGIEYHRNDFSVSKFLLLF